MVILRIISQKSIYPTFIKTLESNPKPDSSSNKSSKLLIPISGRLIPACPIQFWVSLPTNQTSCINPPYFWPSNPSKFSHFWSWTHVKSMNFPAKLSKIFSLTPHFPIFFPARNRHFHQQFSTARHVRGLQMFPRSHAQGFGSLLKIQFSHTQLGLVQGCAFFYG